VTLAQPAYGAQDLNLLFGMGEVVNLADSEQQIMHTQMRNALIQRGFNVQSAVLSGQDNAQLLTTMRGEDSDRLVVLDATRISEAIVVMLRHTRGTAFRNDSVRLAGVVDFENAVDGLVDSVVRNDRQTQDLLATQIQARPRVAAFDDAFFVGVGMSTGTTIQKEADISIGFLGKARYEMQNVFVDSQLMFNWTHPEENAATFALDWTAGSGYLFGQQNTAPFISYGIGLSHMSIEESIEPLLDKSNLSKGTGISGYVGLGLEFLRNHHSRLIVDARVTLPAFMLNNEASDTELWLPSVRGSLSFIF
jgi:hypothetical protein